MKKVIFTCVALIAMAVTSLSVKFAVESKAEISYLTLAGVEALADAESYACGAGGPGSTSCSVTWGISGSGNGCSVTCNNGYYACCNAYYNRCGCRKAV